MKEEFEHGFLFFDIFEISLKPTIFLKIRQLRPRIDLFQRSPKFGKILIISFGNNPNGLNRQKVHNIISNKEVPLHNLMFINGHHKPTIIKLWPFPSLITFNSIIKGSLMNTGSLIGDFVHFVGGGQNSGFGHG